MPTRGENKTISILGKEYLVYDRYWYNAPEWVLREGFLTQIRDVSGTSKRLPADILYFNWCYSDEHSIANSVFHREGKQMILANALPSTINDYQQRFRYGAQGISKSSWSETSTYAMKQWCAPFERGYGSMICWSHERDEMDFRRNVLEKSGDSMYNEKKGSCHCVFLDGLQEFSRRARAWQNGRIHGTNLRGRNSGHESDD